MRWEKCPATWKPQKNILVVEDDNLQRQSMVSSVFDPPETDNFSIARILEAASGEEALQIAESELVDLMILDVCLAPDGLDGFAVCNRLRQQEFFGRIIMLSGERADGNDRADGLTTGADDFVAKPYSRRELRARIDVQLRSAEEAGNAVLRFGPFAFFRDRQCVFRTGMARPQSLTQKESAIVLALYQARGKVITKERLLDEVWGYHPAANTHTLETHIYRVREKLEPNPRQPEYVLNSDGGYRLAGHGIAGYA